MSLLRFTSSFTSLFSRPGRVIFPSVFLFFGTSLIGVVPLAYLLVPLSLVFLILSMLVAVEVIRDTGSHGAAQAVAPVRVDATPLVACQMLRSARGGRDGASVGSFADKKQ